MSKRGDQRVDDDASLALRQNLDRIEVDFADESAIGVGEIGGNKIATAPGPITRQLDELFDTHVADYVTRRLATASR